MFYDGIGNRTSMPASIAASSLYSGTTSYSYDTISGTGTRSQLTQESSTRNSGYTNNFAYDGGSYTATTGVGNPTTMRGSSVSYNVNNQISTNTYDGDGNPIFYKANTLSFDPEDRMTGYGSAEANAYNGDHHRTAITTASGTSYYIFDGDHPFLTEDTTGTVTKVVTWGLLGVALSHTTTSSFYTWDPQGSLCQKLDSSGTVLYSRMYDAFGNVIKTDSDTDSYASFGGQWGYFLDSATGLEQLGHRFYDPAVGRFLNRDPISYRGGLNLYRYVNNNPLISFDPTGEIVNPTGVIVGGILGGVTGVTIVGVGALILGLTPVGWAIIGAGIVGGAIFAWAMEKQAGGNASDQAEACIAGGAIGGLVAIAWEWLMADPPPPPPTTPSTGGWPPINWGGPGGPPIPK